MAEFKLTEREADALAKIAKATKMDSWFAIMDDMTVADRSGEGEGASGARLVLQLEGGISYGLSEPQSGSLTPEEMEAAEECFSRARVACVLEDVDAFEADVIATDPNDRDAVNALAERYSKLYDDDVYSVCGLSAIADALANGSEDEHAESERIRRLLEENPDSGWFFYDPVSIEPVGLEFIMDRLSRDPFGAPRRPACREEGK